MDKYEETFETWNKIAQLYQDKFMHLEMYNETYDVICHSITVQNPHILEIGCGPGNITKYLLSKRPDFNIYGIDIATNMIELAKANNPTANFDVMDCRNIDELNATYDAIIGGFCLPYLSETESIKLFSDSYKLLSGQGLLYMSFVEGDPKDSGFKTGSNGNRAYFYYHHLDYLQQQLIKLGFEKAQVYKVDYLKNAEGHADVHTILITRKNNF